MAAFAPIVLADGKATPVNHTFDPSSINADGLARWTDRSGGIAVGYPVITHLVKSPTKGSSVYRVTAKVVLPILEITSPATSTGIQPAPTKAYDLIFTVEAVLPERSTLGDRKDANAFLHGFLLSPQWIAAVNNFETNY